jgi:predicted Zn-ribbon and HTH transcriptional regulator
VNELTTRQKIIEALKGHMLTAREISQSVGVKEKEVLDHLPHIARSLAAHEPKGPELAVEPSECLECGYSPKETGSRPLQNALSAGQRG